MLVAMFASAKLLNSFSSAKSLVCSILVGVLYEVVLGPFCY